jgi:hypothetical protein
MQRALKAPNVVALREWFAEIVRRGFASKVGEADE